MKKLPMVIGGGSKDIGARGKRVIKGNRHHPDTHKPDGGKKHGKKR